RRLAAGVSERRLSAGTTAPMQSLSDSERPGREGHTRFPNRVTTGRESRRPDAARLPTRPSSPALGVTGPLATSRLRPRRAALQIPGKPGWGEGPGSRPLPPSPSVAVAVLAGRWHRDGDRRRRREGNSPRTDGVAVPYQSVPATSWPTLS